VLLNKVFPGFGMATVTKSEDWVKGLEAETTEKK